MGTLYLVPTPVGNLEDMTFRAIRILREADMVLCEDTRTSSVLLKHFEVQNRLVAHHKFNEHGTAAGLVERLKAGAVIALVSDAGTPGISDPGFLLAREAIPLALRFRPFREPRPLFRPWCRVDCPATASALRVSCRRRRDARRCWSISRLRNGR